MTNNTPQASHPMAETFAIISRNICTQLIALQKSIDAREEGQRHPSPQDIAMQCKLIGCLDKLRRLSGEKVLAKVRRPAPQAEQAEPHQEQTTTVQAKEASPITEQDFKEYKHLLSTFKQLRDTDTIRFRGRYVNCKWLQYNLLQYCLPVADRTFIGDARRVIAEVNYAATQEMAKQYLAQKTAA